MASHLKFTAKLKLSRQQMLRNLQLNLFKRRDLLTLFNLQNLNRLLMQG